MIMICGFSFKRSNFVLQSQDTFEKIQFENRSKCKSGKRCWRREVSIVDKGLIIGNDNQLGRTIEWSRMKSNEIGDQELKKILPEMLIIVIFLLTSNAVLCRPEENRISRHLKFDQSTGKTSNDEKTEEENKKWTLSAE